VGEKKPKERPFVDPSAASSELDEIFKKRSEGDEQAWPSSKGSKDAEELLGDGPPRSPVAVAGLPAVPFAAPAVQARLGGRAGRETLSFNRSPKDQGLVERRSGGDSAAAKAGLKEHDIPLRPARCRAIRPGW
jgi:hypothetical protein